MRVTIHTEAQQTELLRLVSEEAEAAIIIARQRPYILSEDDDGTHWAWSWIEEGEQRAHVKALSIPLPWTVVHTPVPPEPREFPLLDAIIDYPVGDPQPVEPGDGTNLLSTLRLHYSYVYLKGDYDERSLPDPDVINLTFPTREEAEHEIRGVAKENGLPEDHYAVVERWVTGWRLSKP